MTTSPPTGLASFVGWLRYNGVTFTANPDGALQVEAPVGIITPAFRDVLAARKPEVLALVTAAPTDTPGIVYDPRGGARVENPPDLRRLLWREGKRLGFPVVGWEGWASFAATAPIEQVADTLVFLDDWAGPDAPRAREVDKYEREERLAIADPAFN